jgi:5,5'-dehydrodivanillate O-demethylase
MYRTTKEENEILTRVGRGTPMGELLRRYWWPVGISADLKDKPTFIRLMGEDLVLFRDGEGRVGVMAALCSHRRANLCLGNTEKQGLRCRYHGWLYAIDGKVLQTPGEPPGSQLKERVRHLSYPAEELGGLIFTYLGPKPAPLIPRYDFLVADEPREVMITGFGNCNWLQCVENGFDPVHVSFTHQDVWNDLNSTPEILRYEETEWGVVYKVYRQGPRDGTYTYREHHNVMPGISIIQKGARWSVPIDDDRNMQVQARFYPRNRTQYGKFEDDVSFVGRQHKNVGWKPVLIEPYKEYRETDKPVLGYTFPKDIQAGDATVMDSMKAIVDRENENLGPAIDEGIILFRKIYLREVEAVQSGRDPKGVIRDASKNQIIIVPTHEKVVSVSEVQAPAELT